jgi:hypothetical protein
VLPIGNVGPGSYGAPAFILSSAAPFDLAGAALALRPRSVARDLGRCDHEYPRWDGHTPESIATSSVLGAPVSHTVGALPTELRPFPRSQPARYKVLQVRLQR